MRTVKEFKDAGLVIIGADLIHGHTGNADSVPLKVIELIGMLGKIYDEWTIAEFAWRENTQVHTKPTFNGDIEWSNNHSLINLEKSKMTMINWNSNIVKWRPLLNQSDPIQTETEEEKEALDQMCKPSPEWPDITDQERGNNFLNALAEMEVVDPVFTQEMSDNGFRVQAGDKFSTEAGEYIAECTNEKSVVFTDENGFLVAINRGYAKPIPAPVELIDGNAYMFDIYDNTYVGFYKAERNIFCREVNQNSTIAGASDCTNIRTMTVAESK
jgi:hypothetical protein